MKAKKILYFMLLITSLIFLSSCQEFIENIKINELETQLEEIEDEKGKLEAQIVELNIELDELNIIEETLKNDKVKLENEITLLKSDNQLLTEQIESYQNQITLLKSHDDLIISYEEEINSYEFEIKNLNTKISENNQEIINLTNTKTILDANIISIQQEVEVLELEILKLRNSNSSLTLENNGLNEQLDDIYNLFNEVSYLAMVSNVKIKVNHTNKFGQGIASQGSGVIFYEDTNRYYILTNNHVIYDEPQYPLIEYVIYDYKGNEYKAGLHSTDPNYDLGILYFTKGEEDLNTLSFSEGNPIVDSTVISIGQPLGQINTISFGEVLGYQTLTLNNSSEATSNVEFDIIRHSSPINGGSSGGVLINSDLEIVGINYAGAGMESTPSTISYAIPIIKVKEYLVLHNFVMN